MIALPNSAVVLPIHLVGKLALDVPAKGCPRYAQEFEERFSADPRLSATTGPITLECEANLVCRIGRWLATRPLPLPARYEFAVLLSVAPRSFKLLFMIPRIVPAARFPSALRTL
jgi:hypothetical protein